MGAQLAAVDTSSWSLVLVVAGNTSLKAIQRTLHKVQDIFIQRR